MEFDSMKRRPFRGIVAPLPKEKESMYIVWNQSSRLPPTVIHQDRTTAIKVAGRMAHENPGAKFYVCKLVCSAVKPLPVDVSYEDLDK